MPLQGRNMAGGRAGRVGTGLLPHPTGLAVLDALGLGEDCSAPPGAPRPQPWDPTGSVLLRAQLAALQVANQALEAPVAELERRPRPGLVQLLQAAVAGRAAQAHPARTGEQTGRRPGTATRSRW
jgi:hypothetical protein